MTRLIHAVEAVLPMDEDIIAAQPLEIWYQVEAWIRGHWPSRFRTVTQTMAGDPVSQGWLQPTMFEMLLALDVPVTRLFTLAALQARRLAG